ncbi:nuclear transport factor 2 family protein [Novosphingobium lentum]|uniref:nuclear transport factor 2 family protein n=1 Tax=Novosphingobium lentum TaxID=145287 RepID=UPI00082AC547|nr:nuclear transport factor 2 family protein [Novosphingobium lentum]
MNGPGATQADQQSPISSDDAAAIHALHAAYWARTDGTDDGAPEDLFSDDALFILGSLTLSGRAEIAAFFRRRHAAQAASGRVTRHIAAQLQLRGLAKDHVATKCIVLAMAGHGALPIAASPPSVADFDDICVRLPGNIWRFERRVANSVFAGPEAPAFARDPAAPTPEPTRKDEC